MSSLTAQFDAVLSAIVDNERRSARRIGQYVDDTKASLQNLKAPVTASPALPGTASSEALQQMTNKQLDALLRQRNIKGRSKATSKAKKIELLLMPTFEQLYAFWLQHGSPSLPIA